MRPSESKRPDPESIGRIRALAAQLRVDSVRCSTAAKSGHPTSSLSAADLMAGLLHDHFRARYRSYIRTTRGETPVLYDADEDFPIGESKVLRETDGDAVTVVAAGITVHEALEAHRALAAKGIPVRVIDAYSIKPLDEDRVLGALRATSGNLVVVEDHWPEGGLGDAVFAAVLRDAGVVVHAVHLAVREMPGSGTPADLLHAAGIDAAAIVRAVEDLVATRAETEAAPGSNPVNLRCYRCGKPASWRVVLGAEDEPGEEATACDEHAEGQLRLRRIESHATRRSA
jgi:transketolase